MNALRTRLRNVLDQPRSQSLMFVTWTLLLASLALLDFANCFQLFRQAYLSGVEFGAQCSQDLLVVENKPSFLKNNHSRTPPNGTEFCPAVAVEDLEGYWRGYRLFYALSSHCRNHIGFIFTMFCILDSMRRARRALQDALDLQELTDFEKRILTRNSFSKRSKVPTVGTTTIITTSTVWNPWSSISDFQDDDDDHSIDYNHANCHSSGEVIDVGNSRKNDIALRRLRIWFPAIATIALWFILTPWSLLVPWSGMAFPCGKDPAFFTIWLTRLFQTGHELFLQQQEFFLDLLWKWVLPVRLWMKPLELYHRLRLLSRWIRYVRYGGPLLRMLVKLQDQFWVFGRTWKQNVQARACRSQRSRSMLFRDLQKLETLAQLQTRLASLPSQLFATSRTTIAATKSAQPPIPPPNSLSTVSKIAAAMTTTPKHLSNPETHHELCAIASLDGDEDIDDEDGQAETEELQNDLVIDTTPVNLAYVEFMKPSPTTALPTPKTTPPSSPAVVQWIAQQQKEGKRLKRQLEIIKHNIIHSNKKQKLTEIYDRILDLTQQVSRQLHRGVWNSNLISPHTRFSVAWRIIVTLALMSELGRLLMSWHFSRTFDLRYRDLTLRMLGVCQAQSRPIRKFIGKLIRLPYTHPWLDTCRQSSTSSQLQLTFATVGEILIDLIGFLDILVWFHTGELDEAGMVVPKPILSRCVIPGTLTQVLDHPTVPQALPHALMSIWNAAGAVGYSRFFRWCLSLYPAWELLVWGPLHRYLFRPLNDAEYLSYTESLAKFTSAHSLLRLKPTSSHGNLEPMRETSSQVGNCGASYSNLFHASIAENDGGYGLYY